MVANLFSKAEDYLTHCSTFYELNEMFNSNDPRRMVPFMEAADFIQMVGSNAITCHRVIIDIPDNVISLHHNSPTTTDFISQASMIFPSIDIDLLVRVRGGDVHQRLILLSALTLFSLGIEFALERPYSGGVADVISYEHHLVIECGDTNITKVYDCFDGGHQYFLLIPFQAGSHELHGFLFQPTDEFIECQYARMKRFSPSLQNQSEEEEKARRLSFEKLLRFTGLPGERIQTH